MSILFEETRLINIELKNRFVRSATGDGFADPTGKVTEKQIGFFSRLAKGGVGFIITGLTAVHLKGRVAATQNSIETEEHIPGFRKLVDTVHKAGARIAVELAHGGRESARFLKENNEKAIGPSIIPDDPYFEHENLDMSEDDILVVIDSFGEAAKRAREAGFDAVQLHGAHAYLLSQFLSPFTNHRNDCWGGTLENRLRLHKEVIRNIREKVGEDYPVLIKMGVQDGFAGGLSLEEGKKAAELLVGWGVDAIEVSQGLRGKYFGETEFRTKIDTIEQEAYFRNLCRCVKAVADVPVIMVGGLRSFELMEEIVMNNEADFISLCRPLIREPDLINKWLKGSRHRSRCISCNRCIEPLKKGETLRCVQEDEAGFMEG